MSQRSQQRRPQRVRRQLQRELSDSSSISISFTNGGRSAGGGGRSNRSKAAPTNGEKLLHPLEIPIKRLKNEGGKQYPLSFLPPSVALSRLDRATELILSEDQLSVRSEKGGYRMIRASHGFHHGLYYYECELNVCNNATSYIRVGWSTRFGELQAPIGYDLNSFGYCSGDGSRVHNRYRDQSYSSSFTTGDIIGCFIILDEVNPQNNEMRFFKNGVDQGLAYSGSNDIPVGVYFPAISLFGDAHVTVNFGPSFILKHDIYGANGCSEAQPMNPEDRKEHEMRIAKMRQRLEERKREGITGPQERL